MTRFKLILISLINSLLFILTLSLSHRVFPCSFDDYDTILVHVFFSIILTTMICQFFWEKKDCICENCKEEIE